MPRFNHVFSLYKIYLRMKLDGPLFESKNKLDSCAPQAGKRTRYKALGKRYSLRPLAQSSPLFGN